MKPLLATLALLALALTVAAVTGQDEPEPVRSSSTTTTSSSTTTASSSTTSAPTTTPIPPTTTTTHYHPPTTATTTAPPPAPAPARASLSSCAGWRDLIAAHFPPGEVDRACAVMLCESEGNPNAVSPTNDHGLFQINRPSHEAAFPRVTGRPWSAVYEPGPNVVYAAHLHASSGWRPWVCAR